MLFSTFCGGNLQNFEGYKTPYKILILGEGLRVMLVLNT